MRIVLKSLRLVLTELGRPDAQKNDWFLWAAGQLAHGMIGVVLAGAMLFFLPPIPAFMIAALGYTLAKEVPDYRSARSWAGARDAAQDSLFVTAGAVIAIAIRGAHERLFIVTVCAAVIGLALGVWARLKGQQT